MLREDVETVIAQAFIAAERGDRRDPLRQGETEYETDRRTLADRRNRERK